jgi:hypothetical protein
MYFARASVSQPYWVYQPGIAFEGLIRRREHPPQNADTGRRGRGELAASIARSPDELRKAATLIEARYAARGYRLCSDDSASRPGATLIATERDALVGTLTLSVDGPHGLAADESYGGAIDAVRHARGGVCELTRLALTTDADSRSVLSALFGAAYLVGRRLHSVTDVFVEVNPRHAVFYRRLFGFVVAAGQRVCPRVMAPAVLLRLEVERLEARLAQIGALIRLAPGPDAAVA